MRIVTLNDSAGARGNAISCGVLEPLLVAMCEHAATTQIIN